MFALFLGLRERLRSAHERQTLPQCPRAPDYEFGGADVKRGAAQQSLIKKLSTQSARSVLLLQKGKTGTSLSET